MVSISRTTVQGRYIFGGDQDSTPPYDVNLSAAEGVVQLTTAPATRRVENSSGGSFAVAQTAQEIFDTQNPDPVSTDNPPVTTPAADNVFNALNSLRVGLLANDTAAITAVSASIQAASDHLNTAQAFYGTVENRITDANNYSASYDVQLKTELSQKRRHRYDRRRTHHHSRQHTAPGILPDAGQDAANHPLRFHGLAPGNRVVLRDVAQHL